MRRILLIVALLLVSSVAQAAVLGPTVYDRGNQRDNNEGSIYLFGSNFAEAGTATAWTFWGVSNSSGFWVTPILVDMSNRVVTGIGEARQNVDGGGLQTYDFSLVAGSDAVDTNITFGWIDGRYDAGTNSMASWNAGVIDWANSPGLFRPGFEQHVPLTLGRNITGDGNYTGGTARDYAINFTYAVPEPTSIGVIALAGGLVIARRRQA